MHEREVVYVVTLEGSPQCASDLLSLDGLARILCYGSKGVALAGALLGHLDVSGYCHARSNNLAKKRRSLLGGDANHSGKVSRSLGVGGECVGECLNYGSVLNGGLGGLVLSCLVSVVHLCDGVGRELYEFSRKGVDVGDCSEKFAVSHSLYLFLYAWW